LRTYLEQFISNYIVAAQNIPNNKFNIMLGLRLNMFVRDRKNAILLQRMLVRSRQQMTKQGFITKEVSANINKSFQSIMRDIYEYVDGQIKSPDKKLSTAAAPMPLPDSKDGKDKKEPIRKITIPIKKVKEDTKKKVVGDK